MVNTADGTNVDIGKRSGSRRMAFAIGGIFLLAIIGALMFSAPAGNTDPADKEQPSSPQDQIAANVTKTTPKPTSTPVGDPHEYEYQKIDANTYLLGANYYFIQDPKDPNNPIDKHTEKIGIAYVKVTARSSAYFRIFIDMEKDPGMLNRLAFRHKGMTVDSFKIVDRGVGKALQATANYAPPKSRSGWVNVKGAGLLEMPEIYQTIGNDNIAFTMAETKVEYKKATQEQLLSGINDPEGDRLKKTKILLLEVTLTTDY